MTAEHLDITIEQYATFDQTLTVQTDAGALFDLTSYTAKMQVRSSAGVQLVEIKSSDGTIVLGGTAGTIRMIMSATVTGALTAQEAVYDLLLTLGSVVTRLVEGYAVIDEGVTV